MPKKIDALTAARVRELLTYDPDIGLFRWRHDRRAGARAGDVAGWSSPDAGGYVILNIDGITVRGHRLAWLYVHGAWPEEQIDHINRDRADNRFANLREVTPSVNNQNQLLVGRPTRTGLLGVSVKRSRFSAHIGINKRRIYLGEFASPTDAHRAYVEAKRRLHQVFPQPQREAGEAQR